MPMSTVGAAQSIVTDSRGDRLEDGARLDPAQAHVGGRPTAVTIHTNVQPLAWNIGSVQR